MRRAKQFSNVCMKPNGSLMRFYSEESKRVAIILSGCGFLDGSDIQETVLFGVNLNRKGIDVTYYAPTEEIEESFNYTTRTVDKIEERFPPKESTRITRKPVLDIKKLKSDSFSCLIIPGGDGSLRNLSNYEHVSKLKRDILDEFQIHSEVERVIKEFHKESKMMVLCEYSPLLACKVLGTNQNGPGIKVTYGEDDPELRETTKLLGNEMVETKSGRDFIFDEKNKIISTPLFVEANNSIFEVDSIIKKIVEKYL